MNEVTLCLPNRFSWGGIELSIESILKRTRYTCYHILVVDNSQAPWNPKTQHHERDLEGIDDDGNRIEYLRDQAKRGNIKLIEIKEEYKQYGHGENIKRLLAACKTRYAMLLSSGTEVIRPDWLTFLMSSFLRYSDAIGLAKSTPANHHFGICWIAPRYIANWMFLDIERYGEIKTDEDWSLKRIPLTEYKYRKLFDSLPPLTNPEYDPPRVFLDTGWKPYQTIMLDKASGGRLIYPMPARFVRGSDTMQVDTALLFWGGL